MKLESEEKGHYFDIDLAVVLDVWKDLPPKEGKMVNLRERKIQSDPHRPYSAKPIEVVGGRERKRQ